MLVNENRLQRDNDFLSHALKTFARLSSVYLKSNTALKNPAKRAAYSARQQLKRNHHSGKSSKMPRARFLRHLNGSKMRPFIAM